MNRLNRFAWVNRMEEWLAGLTIKEKIQNLESGKLMFCRKCGKIFFDKELPDERWLTKCKPKKAEHEFIEFENYIVLLRNFRGVRWVVNFPDDVSPEKAVTDFFQFKK